MTVLANNQVGMTPWSERALGSEQRNESCFTCRLLDFLDWMLPPALKASCFLPPHTTYILHSQGLKVYLCLHQRHLGVCLGAQHLCIFVIKGSIKVGKDWNLSQYQAPQLQHVLCWASMHTCCLCNLSDASKHWQEGGLMPQPTWGAK